jgi:hypothetical protein
LRTLEKLLPLAERKLWSEGEPAFGQRVEEILGGRFPSGK